MDFFEDLSVLKFVKIIQEFLLQQIKCKGHNIDVYALLHSV